MCIRDRFRIFPKPLAKGLRRTHLDSWPLYRNSPESLRNKLAITFRALETMIREQGCASEGRLSGGAHKYYDLVLAGHLLDLTCPIHEIWGGEYLQCIDVRDYPALCEYIEYYRGRPDSMCEHDST
eukprot:TRINITY_DN6355_c0_g1_i1.p1 TRINITY_DN6355_c0_g1~~TRINITY_DN6355_c0_g1_i1.p1  ORF type:complete len:126 (+),score=7.58 TRINITY_DN6355_c0_g1_i1:162-539(+)